MPASRPSFGTRLPGILVGTGVAVFAFYFLFLRPGKAPAAEASPAPKVETAVPPPAAVPAPAQTPVPPPEPAAPEDVRGEPASQDSSVDRLLAAGQLLEARAEIASRFGGDIGDPARADLAAKAVALNQRLLVTQPDPRDVEFAEIVQGENPTTFSRRFRQLHGEYGVVQLVNNIRNVSAIRAGTKLRVPKGTWSILVDKSLFTLYLCYEGAPYKSYRVCIGADDKTPAAKFTLGTKNPKPTWFAPSDWLEKEKLRNPIPYGHPKNPLGEYWLGLDNPTCAGLGIHGTNAPDSIGTRASMGCVRMLNEDVLELARIAWKGMDVAIVE